MITIPKTINVTATTPFTYTWELNGCNATVTPTGGTQSTSEVEATFTFFDPSDITTCNIELSVIDGSGCDQTFDVDFVNPCESFNVSINNTIGYFFVAQTVGGNGNPGSFTYEWTFDTNVWDTTQTSFGIATLIGVPLPTASGDTTIFLTVIDEQGCTASTTFDFTFCKPAFSDLDNVPVPCNPSTNSGYGSGSINLAGFATECSGDEIDWSTFQITSITQSGTPTSLSDWAITQSNTVVYIHPTVNLPDGDYVVTFTVETQTGILSEPYQFTVVLAPGCLPASDDQIFLQTCDCFIEACTIPGTYTINIDDCLVATSANPATVEVINAGPFIPGNLASYDASTNLITYVANNLGAGADQIWVTLTTTDGVQSPIIVINVFTACTPDNEAPVASDDTACIFDDGSTSIDIDVLTNDTGVNIDPSLTQVVDQASFGTAIVLPSGEINYAPGSIPFDGIDTFTYEIYNAGGVGDASNTATVTVYGTSAGSYNNLTVCDDGCTLVTGIFNIERLHPNFTSGGTYTALGYNTPAQGFDGDNTNTGQVQAADPAVLPVGWPGHGNVIGGVPPLIDVRGASPGFYFVEYDVESTPGCSSTKMYVLELLAQPNAGDDAAAFECIPDTGSNPAYVITDFLDGADAIGSSDEVSLSCTAPIGLDCDSINWNENTGAFQIDSDSDSGIYVLSYQPKNVAQTSGQYPFTMIDECASSTGCIDTAFLTLTVDDVVNLGNNITYSTCESNLNLLTQYDILSGGTGAPSVVQNGGTWTIIESPVWPAILGAASYNMGDQVGTTSNPTITLTGATVGDYVFSYQSGTMCEDIGALTVTKAVQLDPGLPASNDGFCCEQFSDAAMTTPCGSCPLDLFTLLNFESPGGSWFLESGPIPNTLTVPEDTGLVDFCGEPDGEYTFRYYVNSGDVGCNELFTAVTLFVYDSTPLEITIEVCDDVTSGLFITYLKPYNDLAGNGSLAGDFSWTTPPAGGYTFIADGDTSNDTIDPSVMTAGNYVAVFNDQSVSTSCTRDVTINLNVLTGGGTATAGNNASVSYCQQQGQISLFAELGGDPTVGGTWSETTSEPPDDYETQGGSILNGDEGLIDITTTNPGVYTFEYSVATGTCGSDTAVITLTVTSEPITDICTPGTTDCEFATQLWNPADTQLNVWDISISADGFQVLGTFRCKLFSSCSANIAVPVQNILTSGARNPYFVMIATNQSVFQEGGYIETMRVYRSDTGVPVDIDVSPTGSNLASPTVVDANDLYYPASGAPQSDFDDYRTALETVIANAINNDISGSAEYGSGPVALVNPQYDGQYGVVSVSFQARHTPPGIWVGWNALDFNYNYYINDSASVSTVMGPMVIPTVTSFVPCVFNTPCAQIGLQYTGSATSGMGFTVNYNQITPTLASEAVDSASIPGVNAGLVCLTPVMRAITTNCTASTYQWYLNSAPVPGETNQDFPITAQVNTGGDTYSCLVTCTNGCTGQSEVLVCEGQFCNPPLESCT